MYNKSIVYTTLYIKHAITLSSLLDVCMYFAMQHGAHVYYEHRLHALYMHLYTDEAHFGATHENESYPTHSLTFSRSKKKEIISLQTNKTYALV